MSSLTPEELREIRARHEPFVMDLSDAAGGPLHWCEECDEEYPCDTKKLLDHVDAMQKKHDLLGATVSRAFDFLLVLQREHDGGEYWEAFNDLSDAVAHAQWDGEPGYVLNASSYRDLKAGNDRLTDALNAIVRCGDMDTAISIAHRALTGNTG